jgi:hypothetical protein
VPKSCGRSISTPSIRSSQGSNPTISGLLFKLWP